jgi:FkbM family methyltransferase
MDNILENLIERASEQMDANMGLFDGYSPVFIYGAGTFAQDVHRVLVDNGLPVAGFIDHVEREIPFLNGMPIYLPEQAALVKEAGKAVVVLGLHNYQADVQKIISRLKKAGFSRIYSSIDLYDFFATELGVRYWLVNRDYYFSLLPVLHEMIDLLADSKSKSLFYSIMEFRLTGDVSKLPEPDLVNPYHPADLPAWKTPLRFVDCGAFDGDTLKDFIKNDISFQSVAAFEPDLMNYSKLSRFVSQNKKTLREADLFPCGVYSSTRQLSFETGQGMASNISGKGATIIQCVALDDAIPTFVPNLIKMDIEGAEYDALLGARQLISEHTPGIAASLYHRPEHLWQLPMLVESIAPGKYNFHMRSHAMNDFELVLYALPKEWK